MGRILNRFLGVSGCLLLLLSEAKSQSDAVFFAEFDTAAYDALPLFADYTGRKGGSVKKIDLRPFCPTPGQQATTGACAGFALGYGAMTVSYALDNGLTERSKIDENRFSASFIYNQIKKRPSDCQESSEIGDAMRLAKQKGNCPASVFERLDDCKAKPTEEQLAVAARYKIRDAGSIFDRFVTPDGKVEVIKNYLMDSIPVIANFEVWRSFLELPPGKAFWQSPKNEQDDRYKGYHFFLITGFDDQSQTFDVLNSWGDRWADGGFAKIAYKDMGKYCAGAYRLIFSDKTGTRIPPIATAETVPSKPAAQDRKTTPQPSIDQPVAESVVKPKTAPKLPPELKPEFEGRWLKGSFDFFRIDGAGTRHWEPVRFDGGLDIYRPTAGALPLGSRFQLTTSDLPVGAFAYVFSCDPEGKVELHFPKTDRPRLSPSENAVVTIPSEYMTLALRKKGTDYLCILYADDPIPGIQSRMAMLKHGEPAAFLTSFLKAFGDLIGPDAQNRTYDTQKMSVRGRPSNGSVVVLPIILAVKTAE